MSASAPNHPISYVARLSGLSTHVVRMWERRYGAVAPSRTESGHRLYSDADIERLRMLRALSEAGHTISRIASLDTDALRAMLRSAASPPRGAGKSVGARNGISAVEVAELRTACETAVAALDERGLNQALAQARMRLSQPVLLEDLLAPLLVWVGDAWHAGTLRVAHEHLASVTIRTFLMRLREAFQPPVNAPKVVLATPAGEPHECGALLAAAAAASAGWNPVFLGPDLPAAEIANAAVALDANVVALSIAMPGDAPATAEEVRSLRRFLPESIPLVLGGAGAAQHRLRFEAPGVSCVASLAEFLETLTDLRCA